MGRDLQTAIVTGAGGAIGRAISDRLMTAGWQVVALDRRFDAVADGMRQVRVDLADPQAVEEAVRDLGTIGAVVNNDAIQGGAPISEQSLKDWEAFLRINVTAPWLVTKHARPNLSDTASIVNVGSVASLTGFAERAAYCASKHALLGLTRALAAELAPVRVNLLALGTIDTPALRELAERSGGIDRYAGRQLSGELGTVEDAADAVEYLVSDRSRFMTGSVLTVDGGLLTKGAFG